MIRKFFSKLFGGNWAGRRSSASRKMIRRIAIEPLELRRLLTVTSNLSGLAYLASPDFSVNSALVAAPSTPTPLANTVNMVTPVAAAPSSFTIAANQSDLGPNNDTAASFTITGGDVNDTYTYSINTTAATPITGSATMSATPLSVPGIDVSALPAGTLTYTVTLSNASGSTGPMTATATLKTPPSGYTIAADSAALNGTSGASTGFTFTGATTGTTYTYTITSTGGSASVSGSGAVTAAAQNVTPINVTSLPAGTLTYSVTLTDDAGNAGTAATATTTLETATVSGFVYLSNGTGFGGISLELTASGSTTGGLYTQTLADGSYSFTGVAAGDYTIQLMPPSYLTAGTATESVTLDAGGSSTDDNFNDLAIPTADYSIRMFSAAAGSLTHYVGEMYVPPTGTTTSSSGSGTVTNGVVTATATCTTGTFWGGSRPQRHDQRARQPNADVPDGHHPGPAERRPVDGRHLEHAYGHACASRPPTTMEY